MPLDMITMSAPPELPPNLQPPKVYNNVNNSVVLVLRLHIRYSCGTMLAFPLLVVGYKVPQLYQLLSLST